MSTDNKALVQMQTFIKNKAWTRVGIFSLAGLIYNRQLFRHTIGHAFFMDIKTLADLETVFRRKVIPQFQ
jgi:hypothetical protein